MYAFYRHAALFYALAVEFHQMSKAGSIDRLSKLVVLRTRDSNIAQCSVVDTQVERANALAASL